MAKKTTFEEAMKRLDEIVERIEDGSVPLEESIRYYEEGMRLGKMCREMLDDANQRITRLREELDSDGEKR